MHDLGFIFLNTYLPWYRRSGDKDALQVVINAGRTLALRFNSRGKYLRSFLAPDSLFIDIMMNVPLIFEVAQITGDQALFDLAVAHCRTTEQSPGPARRIDGARGNIRPGRPASSSTNRPSKD